MPDLIPVRQYMSALPETIDEDLSLGDAKDRMYALDVRHLPVLREGRLIGILSQRDVAVAESLAQVELAEISVRQVMTQVPFTCGPNAHVEAVAREMAEHRYGSAIVVEPGHPTRVLGVFTTTDALRALAEIVDGLMGKN
ncbi:inosine 5'-monophosphate dehydrogenase [Enhygromyxa salina]|uniref:Inosine 5'-monophosphate dehydrogenase n=1 Tax=Enhygromyxa salina TaxID=215803 RepID=A0A2S9YCQ9_9BACT|nr:CBS domain-containing protein [Enhygromyxa salina]PRQ02885.1 inosine 5'-monophosphate dehydrogenase [Enhygromyxa salina]